MHLRDSLPGDWLLDAPLFIDDQLITSLYYAVALPEFEEEYVTISTTQVKTSKWSAGGAVEAEAGTGPIAHLLASLKIKAKVQADRGGETQQGTDDTIRLVPVKAPERRLLNLAVHYVANLENRVWNVWGLDDDTWINEALATVGEAKPLVFLDVPSGSPIVPMAAELTDGKVVLFFNRIAAAIKGPGEKLPPEYPQIEDAEALKDYWEWFMTARPGGADTSYLLMNVVEETIGAGGRPRWIDYRVPLGRVKFQTDSLHLHIKGRQIYDTGDFAYHFVHRGRKHGFRVVGTLKEGPALNVLAIYEK
jgi:hypothetical protein